MISIFESKLDSLPQEAFEWPAEENSVDEGIENLGQNPAAALASTETMAANQYLAPTENALIAAGSNPRAPPPVAIKRPTAASGGGGGGSSGNLDCSKNALVMGPPPTPPLVKAPGGPPPLRTSFGKPPPSMPTAAPVA